MNLRTPGLTPAWRISLNLLGTKVNLLFQKTTNFSIIFIYNIPLHGGAILNGFGGTGGKPAVVALGGRKGRFGTIVACLRERAGRKKMLKTLKMWRFCVFFKKNIYICALNNTCAIYSTRAGGGEKSDLMQLKIRYRFAIIALILSLLAARSAQAQPMNYGGLDYRAVRAQRPTFGIKTNVLYWATTSPNVALEVATGKKWTFKTTLGFNAWDFDATRNDEISLRHWLVQPEVRVEICSKCHPFFTGKQKLVDTGGRVDRFKKRFNMEDAQ